MSQLSGNVKQYIGRTVDLLAFDDATASGDTQLTQKLVLHQQSGALITGIEKLVQRFVIEFLTEQGSLVYYPRRGTSFMTQIRSGFVRTSEDLTQTFAEAELVARTNLQGEENLATDPPDERFAGAELVTASIFGDEATLTVRVTSAAGETRVVIYPLRTAVI